MKSSKRKICQALAVVAASAGTTAAMATGPVVQIGGASLVAPLVNMEIAHFSTDVGAFTYFSVGSAAGQNAFLNNQPTFFGAGVTGTVDFANSDAALLASQVSGYTLAGSSGPLIQIPYIVTTITIPVVNNGQTITSTTTPQTTPGQSHSIALNDNDLCGVLSGKLTNWNQVTNPETGSAYSTSAPITVVYRTDGSGATELLTRHLSQVCSTGTGGNSNVSFVDSLTFTDSFQRAPLPSNFVGGSGDGGVRTVITNASGATVAYLSPAYTNTFLAPSSSVTTSAGAAQLQVASLVNSNDGQYYAPTYQNATTAIGTVAAPVGRQATNPLNWVLVSANPDEGYPVSGTSQVILSQCYKDPNVTQAIAVFLATHYTNPDFVQFIHGNGFDTVASSYLTAIQNDFLSASSLNLNFDNGNVCKGSVVGR
ncbi:substrate-binding domain-containing protein [Burkholderia plantarii]|uniref:substrate-binding domain-containing protein n=1 Tax=Burkholderia plantarii TaxID=41899 RepID=UPI0018DDA4D8|nr:substrate-binding domain-containing protein [Burkholderia plantarii]MBI0329114.1 substrate-binding domain-containing protein [Burkholderia plantarii]